MNLDRTVVGDVHVLTPHKNLMGGKETADLLAAADEVTALGKPRLIIDLGRIDFINSTGLGALMKIHISCGNRAGWLHITGVSKRIKNVLLMTRILFVLDTFETLDEALAGGAEKRDSAGA